jgi:hypothetical protein
MVETRYSRLRCPRLFVMSSVQLLHRRSPDGAALYQPRVQTRGHKPGGRTP